MMSHFSLVVSKIPSLSFSFNSLITCLDRYLFDFTLLGVHGAFSTCFTCIFLNLGGNFSATISSLSLSSPSGTPIMHVLAQFMSSQALFTSFNSSFFFLLLKLINFKCLIFKFAYSVCFLLEYASQPFCKFFNSAIIIFSSKISMWFISLISSF